jgi:hypothetical protein
MNEQELLSEIERLKADLAAMKKRAIEIAVDLLRARNERDILAHWINKHGRDYGGTDEEINILMKEAWRDEFAEFLADITAPQENPVEVPLHAKEKL